MDSNRYDRTKKHDYEYSNYLKDLRINDIAPLRNSPESPKNILVNLMGTVGDLSKTISKAEYQTDQSTKDSISESLSGAFLDLVDLATKYDIDLTAAVGDKLAEDGIRPDSQPVNRYPRSSGMTPPSAYFVDKAREEADGSE